MNTRTVKLGESAENIHLKKEIEYLSKMIRNHKAQQLQKFSRNAQLSNPKFPVRRTVPVPVKSWTSRTFFPNSYTPKQPSFQKGFPDRAGSVYLNCPQQQQPSVQPSKYKLVKVPQKASTVRRVLPTRTVSPKARSAVFRGPPASTHFASNQAKLFSPSPKTQYKFVNRQISPKPVVGHRISATPRRFLISRLPSSVAYIKPYGIRGFRKHKIYTFSSAFGHAYPTPWYRFRSSPRLYQQQQRAFWYRMKYSKKVSRGNAGISGSRTGKSHVVSIGGLWYRASQTKLSRTTTPMNKKVLQQRGSPRLITVMGVKYQMDAKGTTLRRITPKGAGGSPVSNKMSRIDVGGQTYMKNSAGLFVKTTTTEKRIFASRAVSRSIYHIQMSHQRKAWRKNNQLCMFYVRFGKCHKGSKCQYVHDPDKVAVCTRFLRGTCKVSGCPFSHKISPDKMPVCSYFLQGRCSSDNCPYRHVKVNPSAGVCKNFLKGHCPQGNKCKERHVTDCPDQAQKGSCSKKECPFRHRKRKATLVQEKQCKRRAVEQVVTPRTGSPRCDRNQDVGSLPSFIALPSVSPELDHTCQQESGKSEFHIRPRFLKTS